MTGETLNPDALDLDAATAGVDLVESDGEYISGPVDVVIERLLDQISARGREAFPGEDTFLRRAIDCYAEGSIHGAVANAVYAAHQGSVPLLGGLGEPDRSVPLRDALSLARNGRPA